MNKKWCASISSLSETVLDSPMYDAGHILFIQVTLWDGLDINDGSTDLTIDIV